VNIYAALSAPATSAGQDQLICSNTTTLNAMTPTVGTGYWMMASGTGMIQDTLNAQTAVTGLGLGLNSFVWITRNGGCFATDTVSVQVVQAPVAQFGLVQFGFDVDFTDQSFGGGGSYAWTFGDGGTSGDQNPHHTYLQAGVYPVRLIITNVCRSDTAYDTVRIGGVKNEDFSDNDMGIELYPNPASGGFVDLRVRGVYGDEVKVRIYSMTGAEVLTRVIDTEGRPEFTQRLELGALLSKGTYTVLLETDQGVKTEKLIVL
jgi:PKD repeat protein